MHRGNAKVGLVRIDTIRLAGVTNTDAIRGRNRLDTSRLAWGVWVECKTGGVDGGGDSCLEVGVGLFGLILWSRSDLRPHP